MNEVIFDNKSVQFFSNFNDELPLILEVDDFEVAFKKLEKAILYFLDHKFERLLQIMYRLDIDEKKFKDALNSNKPSESIAKLVIEREIQKVNFRKMYS